MNIPMLLGGSYQKFTKQNSSCLSKYHDDKSHRILNFGFSIEISCIQNLKKSVSCTFSRVAPEFKCENKSQIQNLKLNRE